MFANLTRTAVLGGQNTSGIFASDLTLAQVKTLTVNQSTGTGRDQSYNGRYQVSTITVLYVRIKQYIAGIAQSATYSWGCSKQVFAACLAFLPVLFISIPTHKHQD